MDSRRIKSEDEEEIDQLADDDNSTSNNSVVELARLNHLEYCLKVLETDQMIVVQPPFTRYKDLKIELDPNNLMTFPMNFSPHIQSELAIVRKEQQNRLNSQSKQQHSSKPSQPPASSQPLQSLPLTTTKSNNNQWSQTETIQLIKLCVQKPALTYSQIVIKLNNGKDPASACNKWNSIQKSDSIWHEVAKQAWEDEARRAINDGDSNKKGTSS